MEIYYNFTIYTILYSLFVILISYKFLENFINKLNWDKELSISLFFWHLLVCFVYIFLEKNQIFPTDASSFFEVEKKEIIFSNFFFPGNIFMFEIINFLRILNFDFFSITILFQSIGSIALVVFANCIIKIYANKKVSSNKINSYLSSGVPLIFILFFFLPSISYWSSTISKDTLTFFAISLFVFGISYKSFSSQLTCLIILAFIRPHILFFFLIYYILLISLNYLSKNFNFSKLLKYLVFIYLFLLIIINLMIKMINLDDQVNISFNLFFLLPELYDYTFVFKNSYSDTNMAMNSNNKIISLFLYIFGPIHFKESNFFFNLWFIENILFILILMSSLLKINSKNIYLNIEKKLILILISCCILFFNSLIVNNYGIIFRQKWPYLLFFIYVLNYLHFTRFNQFNNS